MPIEILIAILFSHFDVIIIVAEVPDRPHRSLRRLNKGVDRRAVQQSQVVDDSQIFCLLHQRQMLKRQIDIPGICDPVNMRVTADPAVRFHVDKALR